MTRDDTIRMAREAGFNKNELAYLGDNFQRLVDLARADEREAHKLTIERLNTELDKVYSLLALAHLNIKQHLEYGFDARTAHSTLISVGRYSPRLKAEMEKNHD